MPGLPAGMLDRGSATIPIPVTDRASVRTTTLPGRAPPTPTTVRTTFAVRGCVPTRTSMPVLPAGILDRGSATIPIPVTDRASVRTTTLPGRAPPTPTTVRTTFAVRGCVRTRTSMPVLPAGILDRGSATIPIPVTDRASVRTTTLPGRAPPT